MAILLALYTASLILSAFRSQANAHFQSSSQYWEALRLEDTTPRASFQPLRAFHSLAMTHRARWSASNPSLPQGFLQATSRFSRTTLLLSSIRLCHTYGFLFKLASNLKRHSVFLGTRQLRCISSTTPCTSSYRTWAQRLPSLSATLPQGSQSASHCLTVPLTCKHPIPSIPTGRIISPSDVRLTHTSTYWVAHSFKKPTSSSISSKGISPSHKHYFP